MTHTTVHVVKPTCKHATAFIAIVRLQCLMQQVGKAVVATDCKTRPPLRSLYIVYRATQARAAVANSEIEV